MPASIPQAPAWQPHWHTRLADIWLRRGWQARLLWPLSLVYGLLVRARFAAYRRGWLRQVRLPVPVIVVGNVVVGGAGKTPTVVAIVKHLKQHGHRPAVVSRGHGRRPLQANGPLPRVMPVQPDTPPHASGDEPALIRLATGVPVYVGRKRAEVGQALLRAHPDTTVLVCDDGLQHLALHADVAVAVFDERSTGNGWLLPAGLLREPWPNAVGRQVDLVLQALPAPLLATVVPCPTTVPSFTARKSLARHAISLDGNPLPLPSLPSQGLTALAGIAKPQAFFDMLARAGVGFYRTMHLADHQDFEAMIDNNEFISVLRKGLVCTEKDAIKLFPLIRQRTDLANQVSVWSVPLDFTPEPAFFAALTERLSSKNGHQTA